MTETDKHTELANLVALRRSDESAEYALHRFCDGRWDFPFVVPWTKSACNVDADVMIIGQDWASEDYLRDPKNNTPDRIALRDELGQDPHLPTNRNVKRWLGFFDLKWQEIYATDVSVFIKPAKMGAKVPMSLLERCASKYTIPQIRIVKPVMAICLGIPTYNSVRLALGKPPVLLADAIKSEALPTMMDDSTQTQIYGVPHAGGQGLAACGGYAKVDPIWQQLAARLKVLSVR
jgi:uracil-DNA glycosylase